MFLSKKEAEKTVGNIVPEVESYETEARRIRRTAFIAVAVSTMTVLCCIVLAPVTYQHIQRVQSILNSDMDFCKVNYLQGILNNILNFYFFCLQQVHFIN